MSSCKLPIIRKIFSIPKFAYYSQNYSGTISAFLLGTYIHFHLCIVPLNVVNSALHCLCIPVDIVLGLPTLLI